MHFLKTLLWIAVAVAVALFAIRNGDRVTVNLWGDLQMMTPIWVIVVLSFLAGLLPALMLHRASRWRWRRKLEQNERQLSDIRPPVPASPAQATESKHLFGDDAIPPSATLIVPPPAGN